MNKAEHEAVRALWYKAAIVIDFLLLIGLNPEDLQKTNDAVYQLIKEGGK